MKPLNPISYYIFETIQEPNEYLVYELCPFVIDPVPFLHRRDMMRVFVHIHPDAIDDPEWPQRYIDWLKTTPEGSPKGPHGDAKTYEETMEVLNKNPMAIAIPAGEGKFSVSTVAPRQNNVDMFGMYRPDMQPTDPEMVRAARDRHLDFLNRKDRGALTDEEKFNMNRVNMRHSNNGIKATTQPAKKVEAKGCSPCGGGRVR